LISKNLAEDWIVGFSDGEATFRISISNAPLKRNKVQVKAYFTLPQDKRDYKLLEIMKNQLGCGILHKGSKEGNVWVLTITNLNDINNVIIPIFDKATNLKTSKSLDYIDFKQVISIMNQKLHLTEIGLKKIKDIISQINTKRDRLNILLLILIG
jgi:hypothetical protein